METRGLTYNNLRSATDASGTVYTCFIQMFTAVRFYVLFQNAFAPQGTIKPQRETSWFTQVT
jgi:hypothetical protein